MSCVVCGDLNIELHHVRSKGSGGPDESWNLMPLCRTHHREIHDRTLKQMTDKSQRMRKWLYDNGWYIEHFINKKKWWNDNLNEVDHVKNKL